MARSPDLTRSGLGSIRLEQAVGPVDLSTAWAYADSMSDVPLLARCGHPVVVSPTRRLRRVARTEGWTILDESGPA